MEGIAQMSMRKWFSIFAVFSLFIFQTSSQAKEGAVLDFEADVIEGEKRRPDLFIQMESSAESLDAILYSRQDFNDFHELDRKWRPKVRKSRQPGRKTQ